MRRRLEMYSLLRKRSLCSIELGLLARDDVIAIECALTNNFRFLNLSLVLVLLQLLKDVFIYQNHTQFGVVAGPPIYFPRVM